MADMRLVATRQDNGEYKVNLYPVDNPDEGLYVLLDRSAFIQWLKATLAQTRKDLH